MGRDPPLRENTDFDRKKLQSPKRRKVMVKGRSSRTKSDRTSEMETTVETEAAMAEDEPHDAGVVGASPQCMAMVVYGHKGDWRAYSSDEEPDKVSHENLPSPLPPPPQPFASAGAEDGVADTEAAAAEDWSDVDGTGGGGDCNDVDSETFVDIESGGEGVRNEANVQDPEAHNHVKIGRDKPSDKHDTETEDFGQPEEEMREHGANTESVRVDFMTVREGPKRMPKLSSKKSCGKRVPPGTESIPKTVPGSSARRQSSWVPMGNASATGKPSSNTRASPNRNSGKGGGTAAKPAARRAANSKCMNFNYLKAPINSVHQVLQGQPGWVKFFQLGDFFRLPWQKDSTMEERAEFILNYNLESESTMVKGTIINLCLKSLAQIFHLRHGNTRIKKDSKYVSPNILDEGVCSAGYLVGYAKKHWRSRYEVAMPLLLLKNPKRAITPGVVEWMESKVGLKDTADAFARSLHKELNRLHSSNAKDGRSLVTPIGPHISLLISGTDGTLAPMKREDVMESNSILNDLQQGLDHIVAAHKAIKDMYAEMDRWQNDGDPFYDPDELGSANQEKVHKLETDLLRTQKEITMLMMRCSELKAANKKLRAAADNVQSVGS